MRLIEKAVAQVTGHKSVPPGFLGDPVHLLALGFGTGCIPVAPGTFGTLVGVAIYLVLSPLVWPWYLVTVALLFGGGVGLCHRAAADLGRHDPPAIVWDEIVGYLFTMTAAPAGWKWMVLGFLLFRFFDIIKPWPVSLINHKIKGGLGIMLDDVIAAAFAFVVLKTIEKLF